MPWDSKTTTRDRTGEKQRECPACGEAIQNRSAFCQPCHAWLHSFPKDPGAVLEKFLYIHQLLNEIDGLEESHRRAVKRNLLSIKVWKRG